MENPLNIDEVNELINLITVRCSIHDINLGDMWIEPPNPRVWNAETAGNILHIKTSIITESKLNCIKSIVEELNLKLMKVIKDLRKDYIIFTPREKP